MFELLARIWVGVSQSLRWVSWIVEGPSWKVPCSQKMDSVGYSVPAWRAAATVKTFMTEPGSKRSVMTRSRRDSTSEAP